MAVVVGKVIASYVVSRLASEVIQRVAVKGFGMSESSAGVLGSIAGIAAGAYTYGAMGAEGAAGGAGAEAGAQATPIDMAQAPAPTAISPTTAPPIAAAPKPGLLTADTAMAPVPAPPITAPLPAEKTSFWDRMMASEKMPDIAASAAGGAAQATMTASAASDVEKARLAELERERQEWDDVDVSKYARLQYPTFKSGGLLTRDR